MQHKYYQYVSNKWHILITTLSHIKQNIWSKKWPGQKDLRLIHRIELKWWHCTLTYFICFQTACYCKLGFSGDGKQCEAINVCLEVRAFDNCIKQTLLVVPNWFYVITQNITCITSNHSWLKPNLPLNQKTSLLT